MCDMFQLLKYFDNFCNFTSHLIKSFPENINFANTISNCLMPEECTLFQTNWKVRFTPLNYGQHDGDIPQTWGSGPLLFMAGYSSLYELFFIISKFYLDRVNPLEPNFLVLDNNDIE